MKEFVWRSMGASALLIGASVALVAIFAFMTNFPEFGKTLGALGSPLYSSFVVGIASGTTSAILVLCSKRFYDTLLRDIERAEALSGWRRFRSTVLHNFSTGFSLIIIVMSVLLFVLVPRLSS